MSDIVPSRKRSGISVDRAYRIQEKMTRRLLDIISSSISFKSTSDHMSEQVHTLVFGDPSMQKAPKWVLSYLEGVWHTKRDDIYHYHLVWLLSVDGRLLTSEQVDALTRMEKELGWQLPGEEGVRVYPADPRYVSPWSRVNSDLSRHVWQDAEGRPMADKPYDARFLYM